MHWIQAVLLLLLVSEIKCQSIVSPDAVGSGEAASDSTVLENCNSRYDGFFDNWTTGQLRLTTFLEDLRLWNCPQYAVECEARTFALNDFTTLVYDRFCDYENFSDICMNGKYNVHS